MGATEKDQRPECRVPLANGRPDYAELRQPAPVTLLLPAMIGGHVAAIGLGPVWCCALTALAWVGGLCLPGRSWRLPAWAVALGSLLPGMALVQGDAARLDRFGVDAVLTGTVLRAEPAASPRMIELLVSDAGSVAPVPRKVRLNLFAPLEIAPGERWQLDVRMRPPRGPANPGSGDPERNLFRAGIDAQGYVRVEGSSRLAEARHRVRVGDLRRAGSKRIAELAPHAGGRHLRALLLGDRSALTSADWALLAATGTTHLLVVSGLHVGMVAAVVLYLTTMFGLRTYSQLLATLVVLGAAGAYALVTGFELPARRAWIMLAVGALLLTGQRVSHPALALAWAAVAVLLFDPMAPLSGGFWLSFLAVAALLLVIAGRRRGSVLGLRGFVLAQLTVSTLLLVPLAVLFGRTPLLAPLVNLVAIPVVAMGLLPAGLLALVAATVGLPGGQAALTLIALGLDMALRWLAALPDASLALGPAASWALPLAVAGAALVWAPWPPQLRALGACVLLGLLPPRVDAPAYGAFRLHLFDVGQGKAALVETRHHRLLYDTGPAFGQDSDAGVRIVVPALRAMAVRRLDRVLISHDHADHSGGLDSVRAAFPGAEVSAPTPIAGAGLCHAGQHWEWDGVRFDVLLPKPGEAGDPRLFNRHSCVLRVRSGDRAVLLPGDIDVFAERRLAAALAPKDVVVAAHHGSRTSSGRALVRFTQPRFVWIPAGCPSPFGHPHDTVVERWQASGASVHGTGAGGMLSWDSSNPESMRFERRHRHRFWSWRAADGVDAAACGRSGVDVGTDRPSTGWRWR